MRNVVFVAPYFVETTMRFVAAAARLSDVRFGLISHEPPEKLPGDLQGLVSGYVRVADSLDAQQLADGVREIAARIGKPERLIGTLEELQVPLAEVREHFGIPGLPLEAARNFRD